MNIKFLFGLEVLNSLSDLTQTPLQQLVINNEKFAQYVLRYNQKSEELKILEQKCGQESEELKILKQEYDQQSEELERLKQKTAKPLAKGLLDKRYEESQDAKYNQKVNNATKEVLFNILSNPKLSDKAFNNLYDIYRKDAYSMSSEQFHVLLNKRYPKTSEALIGCLKVLERCMAFFGLFVTGMCLKEDRVLLSWLRCPTSFRGRLSSERAQQSNQNQHQI